MAREKTDRSRSEPTGAAAAAPLPAGVKLLRTLEGHTGAVRSVAFDPREGSTLASGSVDKTVKLWEVASGKLLRTLEGHTGWIDRVAFSPDGRLMASKSYDHKIRLWNCDSWETITVIPAPTFPDWIPALAFHPTLPLLATAGSAPDTPEYKRCRLIHVYELDYDVLLPRGVGFQPAISETEREAGSLPHKTVHYVNAKVVLLGDSGVGKSGLGLVLNGQPYKETDSTAGRFVSTFDSREVVLDANRKQTRETLLWDMAGQPGYRVINQLHLNEVAVALVVFDARSETDPLAGVRHWGRALRLAQQRQGAQAVPTKTLLVSARNDRGGVSVSKERLDSRNCWTPMLRRWSTRPRTSRTGWGRSRKTRRWPASSSCPASSGSASVVRSSCC
jgi:hypothetical protein